MDDAAPPRRCQAARDAILPGSRRHSRDALRLASATSARSARSWGSATTAPRAPQSTARAHGGALRRPESRSQSSVMAGAVSPRHQSDGGVGDDPVRGAGRRTQLAAWRLGQTPLRVYCRWCCCCSATGPSLIPEISSMPTIDRFGRADQPRGSGSNPKMLDKAGLPADQVFLDLEDCGHRRRRAARQRVSAALAASRDGKIEWYVSTMMTLLDHRDVITIVEGAGANLDCIMLPKVQSAAQVTGRPPDHPDRADSRAGGGRLGIEARIENAGPVEIDAIMAGAPRDTHPDPPTMASINMKSLVAGEQPPGYDIGDDHVLLHAHPDGRSRQRPAIDGPYFQIRDIEGFRRVAGRSAALGFDAGAASRSDYAANEAYSPAQNDYDHAEPDPGACTTTTRRRGGRRGNRRRGDDRRSVAQMALVVAAKGRAAGPQRAALLEPWTRPVLMARRCARSEWRDGGPRSAESDRSASCRHRAFVPCPARLQRFTYTVHVERPTRACPRADDDDGRAARSA